jgi:hypothetical protein
MVLFPVRAKERYTFDETYRQASTRTQLQKMEEYMEAEIVKCLKQSKAREELE